MDRPADPMDSDPWRDERERVKQRETDVLKVLRQSSEYIGEIRGLVQSIQDSQQRVRQRLDDYESCIRSLEDQIDGCTLRKVEQSEETPQAGGAVLTVRQRMLLAALENPIPVALVIALLVVLLTVLASQGVSLASFLPALPSP